MAGRRPLPAKMKEARGDLGKRGIRPNPQAPPGIPDPPASVQGDPLALAEYKRIGEILLGMSVVTLLDRSSLADHVLAFAIRERCFKVINNEMKIADKKPAIFTVALDCMKLMEVTGEKLGLNPAARGRLYTAPGGEDPSKAAFRKFLEEADKE